MFIFHWNITFVQGLMFLELHKDKSITCKHAGLSSKRIIRPIIEKIIFINITYDTMLLQLNTEQ
jgi:hypothetical protein